MICVIIPAHNEEKVIRATIEALFTGVVLGEVELIVVCNGCTDNTSEVVASFGDKVKCVETPIASKTHALNLGDKVATGFPRIYLDADVVLSFEAVQVLASELKKGVYLAASPVMHMEFHNASSFVKNYYDIWQQLPYVREGMIGTGVFALSEIGRSRFREFPDIIADDGFIRAIFKREERVAVKNCLSVVRSPANLAGLIKIKTRSRLGRYELAEKFPELVRNEKKDYGAAIFSIIIKIENWFKIAVYLYVNLWARVRANKYLQERGFTGWERDDSSREY